MRILILGGAGMAGHLISLYLRENGFEVDTLSARHKLDKKTQLLDVMDAPRFTKYLSSNKFDVIVNCIGILVQQSEDRKDLAAFLNAYFPHSLEYYFKDSDTKLIHLSTDCVFSGNNAPYSEDSAYDGELFYDRSKALGEVKNDKDLTFRMSIIGPEIQTDGVGLFNWFYRQKGEINGYTKAIWNGITTLELARGIKAAIEQELTGIYQLVPEKNISKFELLEIFRQVFDRKDITIAPDHRAIIDKTLINSGERFNFKVSDYQSMIEDMRKWIEEHPYLYPHYLKNEG